jgi:hypothetical protein
MKTKMIVMEAMMSRVRREGHKMVEKVEVVVKWVCIREAN